MRGPIMLLPLLGPLAACTGSYDREALTDRQQAELATALAGKVAGPKTSCISRVPQTNLSVISNGVLLYKVSRKLVYKNDLIGRCNGLTRGDPIVLRSFGSQICRGDFATTVNVQTGMITGSCALGDFTSFRTASGQ